MLNISHFLTNLPMFKNLPLPHGKRHLFRFQKAILLLLLTLLWLSAGAPVLRAQTRLGLHVTQEELNIWKQRRTNGPYLTYNSPVAGQHTPGDWTRIVGNANTFLQNPSSDRYTSPAVGGCVILEGDPATSGQLIKDAGFAHLVTSTDAATSTHYSVAVKNELLRYADPANNFDFTNQDKWCYYKIVRNSSGQEVYRIVDSGSHPYFVMSEWLVKLLFAYDYTKATFSAAERNLIDNWFYGAGIYFQHVLNGNVNNLFESVGCNGPTYTTTPIYVANNTRRGSLTNDDGVQLSAYSTCAETNDTRYSLYLDGPTAGFVAQAYNNRRNNVARFVGLVGVFLDNEVFLDAGTPVLSAVKNNHQQQINDLKIDAKLYFREWLKYGVFPGGDIADMHRATGESGGAGNTDESTERGLNYAFSSAGAMIDLADAFGRDGDYSLYNYKTSVGYYNRVQTTTGGAKTLLLVIQNLQNYLNGTLTRYGTLSADKNTSFYKIDGVDAFLSQQNPQRPRNTIVYDTWFAVANAYYKDATVRANYLRTADGTTPYPSLDYLRGIGPNQPWSGQSAIYPGVLFMFGQMEDNAANPHNRIRREEWTNVDGKTVDLIPLTLAPAAVSFPQKLEGPVNSGDRYGARYRGFVHPPTTGNYVFWIASDNESELWLKTDDVQPAQKIAAVHTALGDAFAYKFTADYEWEKYVSSDPNFSQKSAPITLTGGKRYYVEVLHKEAFGGDHLAVGWQVPANGTTPAYNERPVLGTRLSPYSPIEGVSAANARLALTLPNGENGKVAQDLTLFPNPSAGKVAIQFTLVEGERATLNVYDLKGGLVARLFDGFVKTGEAKRVEFDGSRYQSGLYVVRLTTGQKTTHQKLTVLR